MNTRQCYRAFGCQPAERLVIIKEQHLADANFVFSYLMKQASSDIENQTILLLIHNTLGHYECVARKLGYNLNSEIETGFVRVIDVQAMFINSLHHDSQIVLKVIRKLIGQYIEEFLCTLKNQKHIYVFIDDFTHIQDFTCDLHTSINYLNEILACYNDDPRVKYIVGLHLGDESNRILSCDLEYSADCIIDVSPLKTGRSDDISGVLKVLRNRKLTTYHYKLKDFGVEISAPGSFLIN